MITSLQKNLSPTFSSISVNPEVLRDRILQFFGVGAGVSLIACFIDYFIFAGQNPHLFSKMDNFIHPLLLIHPFSFFLGFLIVTMRSWSSMFLQIIDLGVSFFNILVMTLIFFVISPLHFLLFPYLLLLFLHAVLIPCKLWVQTVLAIAVAIAYLLGQILSYFYLSEVQRLLLMEGGSKAFWRDLVLCFVEIDILAGLSVLVTQTFYRSAQQLSKAQRLGNYIIEKELGTGGMGKVYTASHQFLCRPAALKVMENHKEDLQTCITRFEREVKLSATLTHPNTITIFDYGFSSDQVFYYAMELLEGYDLNKMVEKFGPLPPERVVYILLQVCGALAEAHGVGVIHRDLKPSNIFLSCRGGLYDFVKVLDFGLAKEMGVEAHGDITQKTIILGTPRYLAPECVYDKDKIDPRSDIYTLGCVAYWLLTGHPPFDASFDAEIIRQHLILSPRKPSEAASHAIPRELEQRVMKCLEKKQEDRYQSISELAEDLGRLSFEKPWSQNRAREWWNLNFYHQETLPPVPISVIFPKEKKSRARSKNIEKSRKVI